MRLKTHSGHRLFALADAATDILPKSASFAKIVADELLQAAMSHRGVTIQQWIIEPESLHALVSLKEERPSPEQKGKPRLLTSFVAALKAATAKRINLMRNEPGAPVWQRSYQEQLVEDDIMLARLRKKLNESDSMVMSG
ncbi:MAG: hypothetical protein AAFU53_13365 [Cyanobacteria bacterium J06632_3]